MDNFRLALVRQKYRPDGGAERFVARALTALSGQNIELNVITRQWNDAVNPNWHIHICNPPKWGRISRERGFAHAARALWTQQGFDLVQSHERIPGCGLYRAGDGVHRRYLEQRCRTLPGWRGKLLYADPYHRYVLQAEREMFTAPELQAVICNAEMVKREIMADFGVADEKIHVIYNGIDSTRFVPATELQRQQALAHLGLSSEPSYLIYVGSGFERKGLATAIAALQGSQRHLLVIGKDKAEQRYRTLARSLGLEHQVHFFGMQRDVLAFYHAADALLLPTRYDPFPNVILEAMACGLPVITSTHCGGAEFIQNGQQGFVTDALDTAAIQEAISQLPPRALGSNMGEAARQQILDCSPQKMSDKLINLYRELLHK
ncbi:glycosyltransferase [Plesiomonas shigelloides]|uniref:glycosyltransferase family 4 protein n=1 Tax=Plesiomonas shigelloides TaxID=703 RepID=UPI0012619457|nr:glycosyltransferase family 4 protein [Plesiomonas shigelloides]KAB7683038.1 glycosyltransferase [Plesiomonas shigelloides]